MNMNMKKIIAVCAVVGAMLFAGGTADARWGHRHFRPHVHTYRYVTPYVYQPYWYYSTHVYHPGRVVWHGNHFHVTPGHWH
jgi:hypothetical protein